jgi:dynein light chain Tctex-type 1
MTTTPPAETTTTTTTTSNFPSSTIEAIIKEATDDVLKFEVYQHSRVAGWNTAIVERCLQKLLALKKSYKYVVTCVIMQHTPNGVHAATSCFWDTANDGKSNVYQVYLY